MSRLLGGVCLLLGLLAGTIDAQLLPPTPPAPILTLTWEGVLTDRVRQHNTHTATDGQKDGTFTLTLAEARTIKQLILQRGAKGDQGVWDTLQSTQYWLLGVARGLDEPLLNQTDGSISVPLTAGQSLTLFASDMTQTLFGTGSEFTIQATFADNSTALARVTIAPPKPPDPPQPVVVEKIRTFVIGLGDKSSGAIQDNQDLPWAWRNDYRVPFHLQTVSCRTLEGTVVIRPQLSGGAENSILAQPCTCKADAWSACPLWGAPIVQPVGEDGAACPTPPCAVDVNVVSGGGKGLRVPFMGTLE